MEESTMRVGALQSHQLAQAGCGYVHVDGGGGGGGGRSTAGPTAPAPAAGLAWLVPMESSSQVGGRQQSVRGWSRGCARADAAVPYEGGLQAHSPWYVMEMWTKSGECVGKGACQWRANAPRLLHFVVVVLCVHVLMCTPETGGG